MAEPKERTQNEKVAAGLLLLGRDRTLSRLMASAATHEAAAREKVRKKEGQAAVLVALLLVGRELADDLGGILARGRAEARADARKRLRAELSALGVEERLPTRGTRRRAAADVASGAITGESLAAQWRSIAAADALRAARGARSLSEALGGSAKALEPRLERASSTEVAQAYNDEHRAVLKDLAGASDELRGRLLREWSAYAEACEKCRPHDGERVGIDESFSGGDEPGWVHPRCQCTASLVLAE